MSPLFWRCPFLLTCLNFAPPPSMPIVLGPQDLVRLLVLATFQRKNWGSRGAGPEPLRKISSPELRGGWLRMRIGHRCCCGCGCSYMGAGGGNGYGSGYVCGYGCVCDYGYVCG